MKKFSLKLALAAVGASALALTACMTDGSSNGSQESTLSVNVGVKDVNKLAKGGLAKSSTIKLAKLVVTLTSSVGTDAVIRDTIGADTAGFSSNAAADQTVSLSYNVRPLRDWVISVQTIDSNGVVIHEDTDTAFAIKVGEKRPINIVLGSKYVMYVAKFTLPDSIGSATGTFKEKLNVNRFMLVIDGDTVRDSSAGVGNYFAPSVPHTVGYDYVTAGEAHQLKLFIFGDMNDWDPNLPLYGDSITIAATDTGTTKTPTLTYTGPGSPSDPNWEENNPGGAKIDPLTIVIGKVGLVEIEPEIPENPLPKN